MRLNRRALLAASLGMPALPLWAQGFDRPPAPGPALALPPLQMAEARLANGMRLLVAERRGLPLVSLRLLLDMGSLADPPAKAGLAQLCLTVLSRGALRDGEAASAGEIAFAAESLGASLEIGTEPQAGSLGMTVASAALEPALELLADLARRPSLSSAELERSREELLDAHQQSLADPAELAQLLARRLSWGPGPGGQLPTPASLARIQRRDLIELQRQLRPDSSALVLAGDISLEQALELAELQFGDWRAPAAPLRPALRLQPQPLPARTLLLDWPGAPQAAIVLATPHAASDAGDGAALAVARLAEAVLGQGYSSRLNHALRIRRGLAYAALAQAQSLPGAGLLLASTQTRPAQAAEAATLLAGELLRMGQQALGTAELQARRAALLGEHGRQLETRAGLAALLSEQLLGGRPVGELARLPEALAAVTPAQLQAFAAQHWRADAQRLVIVADLAAAGPGLRALDPAAWVIPRTRLDLGQPTLRGG